MKGLSVAKGKHSSCEQRGTEVSERHVLKHRRQQLKRMLAASSQSKLCVGPCVVVVVTSILGLPIDLAVHSGVQLSWRWDVLH